MASNSPIITEGANMSKSNLYYHKDIDSLVLLVPPRETNRCDGCVCQTGRCVRDSNRMTICLEGVNQEHIGIFKCLQILSIIKN